MRLLLALLLVAPAPGARADASSAASPSRQEPFRVAPYIGAAGGGGDGWVMVGGNTNRSLGLFGEVRAGFVLHPILSVDLDASILTLGQSYQFPTANPVLAIRLANVYVAASLFPFDDALFVRAGVGHGWLSATNGFDPPSASLAADGLAVIAGAGYRLWLADQASLTLAAQALAHRYGTSGMKADAVTLSVAFDFYFRRGRR